MAKIKKSSKRKVADDYRDKITHENERYKLSDKKGLSSEIKSSKKKLSYTTYKSDSNNEEAVTKKDVDIKIVSKLDSVKNNEDSTDNKSVDTNKNVKKRKSTLKKSDVDIGDVKEKVSKIIKRKNYVYTRDKEVITLKESEHSLNRLKKLDKPFIDKSKSIEHKKKVKKLSSLKLMQNSVETTRDYLSNGSDENVGVEAKEKELDAVATIIKKTRNKLKKRRSNKRTNLIAHEQKLLKKESKLQFDNAKTELKKSESYKKANFYKRLQKKKQVKAAIYKNNNARVRDRIKKELINTLFDAKEMIRKNAKGVLGLLLGVGLFLMLIMQFAGSSMSVVSNTSNNVLTTTYLSNPSVLHNVNNYFLKLESKIQDELENVKSNYPGYDEYILDKKGDVGHDIHELLAYITSRCGEVKDVSEVQDVLDDLFNSMYKVSYKEEVEIRYKRKYFSYINDQGVLVEDYYDEPYEYKKLYITLSKKEMDEVIREKLSGYKDNITHYEALLESKGNMQDEFANKDLIVANGGEIGGGKEYEASSDVQKSIVDAAYKTPSPGPGWCAMWVSQVYKNAGLGYIGGNANDMYRNFTYTSDISKLKVGMIVAVESASNGGELGITYGHVGVYIGDGKVMDNIGRIRVTTLDNWIATFCKHHPVGFGYPPSVNN